jgi:hypothetical protein
MGTPAFAPGLPPTSALQAVVGPPLDASATPAILALFGAVGGLRVGPAGCGGVWGFSALPPLRFKGGDLQRLRVGAHWRG